MLYLSLQCLLEPDSSILCSPKVNGWVVRFLCIRYSINSSEATLIACGEYSLTVLASLVLEI